MATGDASAMLPEPVGLTTWDPVAATVAGLRVSAPVPLCPAAVPVYSDVRASAPMSDFQ